MGELLQAISKTAYPDGKTKIYQHGMMPIYRAKDRINVWYRWVHMLNLKNEKNKILKQVIL